jgi:hypothetical protein
MKLLTVLAATAVAAAVAAALSISAGADPSAGDQATKLANCLHAHGAADAPSGADPLALKQWVAANADNPAVAACNPGSRGPAELVSCLRAHGLNPPANLDQLKPWMVRQAGTDAGKAALHACGVDVGAPQKPVKDMAACLRSNGAGVPAGADGLALKTWIREHSGDPTVLDALKRCGGGADTAAAKASNCGGGATPTATPSRQPAE